MTYYLDLPMGVNEELCFNSNMLHLTRFYISSGARPALPMGVAPEATAKCLYLVVGSPFCCFIAILSASHLFSFLSGARPALPMGVAPEATAKCLHLGVGSTCF